MANDNNELKNNAPCEEKQEAHKLTEEELAQVSGGTENELRGQYIQPFRAGGYGAVGEMHGGNPYY